MLDQTTEANVCKWCQHAFASVVPVNCPNCGMSVSMPESSSTAPLVKEKPIVLSRRKVVRETPFSDLLTGNVVLGIDPGARYTGVVLRDNDTVLFSSILVRPKEMEPLPWAVSVVEQIKEIHHAFPNAKVAIEGISDPKGFNRGKRAAINPRDIMRAAAVAGGCAVAFVDSVIIPPGGNGSQDISQYPDCLIGRRPKDLPGSNKGAGTRSHEQSAFDVAGKAALIFWDQTEEVDTES